MAAAVLAAGGFAAAGVLSADTASAHQSGCHRWHSCPSDSGSYTCGDLGYPCQYPTYPSDPSYPPPSTASPAVSAPCDSADIRASYYGPYGRARWPYVRCSLEVAGFPSFRCVGSGLKRKWPCQVTFNDGSSYLIWFHVTPRGDNVVTLRTG